MKVRLMLLAVAFCLLVSGLPALACIQSLGMHEGGW